MTRITMDEDLHYLICIPSLEETVYVENIASKSEKLSFFVTTSSVQTVLVRLGFHNIHFLHADTAFIDMSAVDQIIVLENNLTSTHFLMKIALSSVKAPILVTTRNIHVPCQVYKLLGAKTVVYSKKKNISYLIN